MPFAFLAFDSLDKMQAAPQKKCLPKIDAAKNNDQKLLKKFDIIEKSLIYGLYTYKYVHIHIHIYAYIHICTFKYIYIHIHIHMYWYIYDIQSMLRVLL
jgi:hypothetical protein